MSLKAVLFDFNGVILDDEPIHRQLMEEILLAENLRSQPQDFGRFCLGRSDRAGLKDLLTSRGRVVTPAYLETLVARKAQAYRQHLSALDSLPLFPGLQELIQQLQAIPVKLAVVSGAQRSLLVEVLTQAQLLKDFPVIVADQDVALSKPEPEGYLLAIQRLNQKYPLLDLQPADCLAIEDTFVGIEAAKRAGISVVGVAHTYPLHMLQRCANWAIDTLNDLEVERVRQSFESANPQTSIISD